MPRSARILSESGYYHVVNRGIGRQILFEDDGKDGFLELSRSDEDLEGLDISEKTVVSDKEALDIIILSPWHLKKGES